MQAEERTPRWSLRRGGRSDYLRLFSPLV